MTRDERETLDLVAACLEYPREETAALARRAAERTATFHPGMARALWALAVSLETAHAGEAEERYTALFDLAPACTLHVGYHLFGDTYQRGAFLVGLAAEERGCGLVAAPDLPDFLPVVLRLLGRVTGEDAAILRAEVLRPALAAMCAALPEARDPWVEVLRALPALAGVDGAELDAVPPARLEAEQAEVATHA